MNSNNLLTCNHEEKGRRKFSRLRDSKGIVIVAVLWISALIMWFSVQISADNRMLGEEFLVSMRKSQSTHLAIGGCYEAIAHIGQPAARGFDDKPSQDVWEPDGSPHLLNYRNGQALVAIEAESKKINVNLAGPEQIRAVLETIGMQEDPAAQLADVIADFIDRDDSRRLHGAEKDQYAHLGLHYEPFNGPLTSIDQMLLIPGVTQQLFYGYGSSSAGSENDSGMAEGMRLVPGENSLFKMLTVYGKNTALRNAEAEQEILGKVVTWEASGIYRIISCGKSAEDSAASVMFLIVRYAPESPKGYEVLYRKIL